jgi:Cu/Ag efflux pump CusA
MALNPQLYGNGMPVAFVGEMFVLARDGVEFQVDKIPGFVSLFSSIFLVSDFI